MSNLEGFLLKQGEKGIKTWKKRYFVVRAGNGVEGRKPHLYYYDKKEDFTSNRPEKGRIDLETINDVELVTSDKSAFEFNVVTPKRVYSLRAASTKEMNKWTKGLEAYKTGTAAPLKFTLDAGSRHSMMPGELTVDVDQRKSFRQSLRNLAKGKPEDTARQTTSVRDFSNLAADAEQEANNSINNIDIDNKRLSSRKQNNSFESPSTLLARQSVVMEKKQPVVTESVVAPVVLPAPVPVVVNQPPAYTNSVGNLGFPEVKSPAPAVVVDPMAAQMIDSWQNTETEGENKALRKRLNKAQALNSKYEQEIHSLKSAIASVTNENIVLKERLEVANNSVDFDKTRREAELLQANQRLNDETKKYLDMKLQFNEVRKELRTLKESIHLARFAPTIQHTPLPTPPNQPPATNNVNTLPVNNVKSIENPHSKPKRPDDLRRSQSVANFSSMSGFENGPPKSDIKPAKSHPAPPASVFNPGNDSRRVPWVPDAHVADCTACNNPFGLFTRKHHCRNCGNIFCNTCSIGRVMVPGYTEPERVCRKCFNALRPKKTPQHNGGVQNNFAEVDNFDDPPVQTLDL